MLKLLLRLWWLQQRRNFHARDAIVGGYLIIIYVVMGVSFYFGFTESGGSLSGDDAPSLLGAGIVVGMLIPDIFMKMVIKKDMTAMDDYVKARPFPERIWNRFLLLTNLVSFWNYVLPVLLIPVLLFFMSISQTIVCFLLFLAYSMVDGLYITCYRKASEWMLKWPLILGWMGMYVILIGYMVLASLFPLWMAYAGLFVLAAAVWTGLIVYLCNLKIYNEQKRKVSRFHGFTHVNLFSLQYIGTMRAKRVRNMVIVMSLIFLFDAYLYAFLPSDGVEDTWQSTVVLYVVAAILMPSECLSQWTFGIEANFFQGLMTKPIKIEQMLRNCFYFYALISAIALLLVVPFLFLNVGVSLFILLGAYGLTIFVNLFNLPTALFSSRLEIFGKSMFNMQGANLKINFFAIAVLVPLGLSSLVYLYVGEKAWCILGIVLGLLALAIHRWAIAKLAAIFYKRRYKRMEAFMEN